MRRSLEKDLKSAKLQKPSQVYQLLSKAAGRSDSVPAGAFFRTPSARSHQKLLAEIPARRAGSHRGATSSRPGAKPGTPKFQKVREELILTRLDARPKKSAAGGRRWTWCVLLAPAAAAPARRHRPESSGPAGAGSRVQFAAPPRDPDSGRDFEFVVRVPDIVEERRPAESPVEYVRRLAEQKAFAVPMNPGEIILAADTAVVVETSYSKSRATQRMPPGCWRCSPAASTR